MKKGRWRARADSLAALLGRDRLHPAVLAWAEARPAGERWAVAFSGGADSLALLLLLWAHWPNKRRSLVVLHFNHRLRGRAAASDARFCRSVCKGLGVRVKTGVWSPPPRTSDSAGARAARFAFFEGILRPMQIRALWFGHQRDDVAESMLMRLARGSGTGGLAAPRPVQRAAGGRVHLRPLLSVAKREIVEALRASRSPWREDATNAGSDHFRNRIRNRIVPAWIAAAGRDSAAGAARSRELLEEDDAALEAWVDRLGLFTPAGRLRLDRMQGAPRAVIRRALHRWLLAQPKAGELSRQGFASLLSAVEAGRPTRHSLGIEGFALIRGNRLEFEPL